MTPLVSSAWRANHLGDPNIVLVVSSFKLPGATRTAYKEFADRHISSAQFFDVDNVAEADNPLPI